MWFKLTYSLTRMHLLRDQDAPFTINIPIPEQAEVVLWVRTFPSEKKSLPQLCCDAIINRKLRPHIKSMFDSLSNGFIPIDKPPVVDLPYPLSLNAVIDADGKIPEKRRIPLDIMPVPFRGISQDVERQLSDIIRTLIKALRWSQGASGKHNPFSFVDFKWSEDKIEWYKMPFKFFSELEHPKPIDLNSEAVDRVRSLLEAQNGEPLAHELLREALDIVDSNPRSSLLIGVSALETGLKEYISFLVPSSILILEKMPSPPAITMVQEVIPNIHKALLLNLPGLPLDDKEKYNLVKWVRQRNQIAHGVKKSIDRGGLIEFLKFIRLLLYKIDSWRGHDWADQFSSDK